MRFRCYNKAATQYEYYGGRGIQVCEAWKDDFDAFVADMGERPEGTTLDRIDPDGDYTPQNCRWATKKEQSRNRRNTRLIEHDGMVMSIAEWTRFLGLSRCVLYERLKTMPPHIALNPNPIRRSLKNENQRNAINERTPEN